MVKPCKSDEIRNPTSKRCVKKNGKKGKELLEKKSPRKSKSPKKVVKKVVKKSPKKCKSDEILNPASNRCVKKNGKKGKELLEKKSPRKSKSPKKSPTFSSDDERPLITFLKKKSPRKSKSPKIEKKRSPSRKNMDALFFFSKSADKPAGKGSNEVAIDADIYAELNTIKDWRKILSNFYVAPFVFEGKTYKSVEHAFQGAKIALVSKEKGEWFTVDSKHPIGQGDGDVARKNRKLVVLTDKDLKKWNERKDDVMERIQHAKFSQVPLAKRVLLLTGDATLLHATRGPPQRQYTLERVRKMLKLI